MEIKQWIMKTLILVRHAKSDWKAAYEDDFDRPLNERGKRDALNMAERVHQKGIRIQRIVTSPARRARKTARAFSDRYEKDSVATVEIPELYLADAIDISGVVGNLPDHADTIALFGHNPGITVYANAQGVVRIDEMPTCSVLALSADVEHWADFDRAEKRFLFFDRPKVD
jgi:phosphohistidine phosphatase